MGSSAGRPSRTLWETGCRGTNSRGPPCGVKARGGEVKTDPSDRACGQREDGARGGHTSPRAKRPGRPRERHCSQASLLLVPIFSMK